MARAASRWALGVVVLCSLVASPLAVGQTAEAIVRKAIELQGGWDKLSGIRSMIVHLSFEGTGRDQLKGDLVQFYQAPDRLVSVLRSYGKSDMIKVYDGKKGKFMRRSDGRVYDMGPKDLREMRQALSRAQLLLLTNLFVKGARFELLRTRRIMQMKRHDIRWRAPDGRQLKLNISGRGTLNSASFGASGDLRVKFTLAKPYDGVRLPSQVKVYEGASKPGAKQTALIKIDKVELGPQIPAAAFLDPREAAKLVPEGRAHSGAPRGATKRVEKKKGRRPAMPKREKPSPAKPERGPK